MGHLDKLQVGCQAHLSVIDVVLGCWSSDDKQKVGGRSCPKLWEAVTSQETWQPAVISKYILTVANEMLVF